MAAEARVHAYADDPAETVRVEGNLPAAFWHARPALGHIRQAAHARGRAADAVLAGVLARVATLTPPTIVLPPIVGTRASLNALFAVVGPPGIGKSSATGCAAEQIPIRDDRIVVDLPVGSGEGLVDAYLGVVEEDDDGKKRKVRRQTRAAVLAVVDEGEVLSQLAGRSGSTLLPVLRTAWSGGTLGQANASAETNRRLEAHAYRLAVVALWQPVHAAAILSDAGAGTPQRLTWWTASDPTVPDDPPPWPGPLNWTPLDWTRFELSYEMAVDADVASGIRRRGLAKMRGELIDTDPLDAHGDLCRLKVAGLLALLDNRLGITGQDWELAGMIHEASTATRSRVAQVEARLRDDANTARLVRRDAALDESATDRALRRAANAVARKAHRSAGATLTTRELRHAIAGRDRQHIDVEEAVAEAVRLEWLTPHGDGWTAGEARPA